jgi:hypothetical protein
MRRALLVTSVVALALGGRAAAAGPALRISLSQPSYRPGQIAVVHLAAAAGAHVQLQVFQAGGASAGRGLAGGGDAEVTGTVTAPPVAVRPGAVRLWIGDWPSGVYVVRAVGPAGGRHYAAFVVRPQQLGSASVLVVEPTNTWQAYNGEGGDSWYVDPGVHVIDLERPDVGSGLPPHFRDYDLGFLRWYWRSGENADFVSDADLNRFTSGAQLRRLYRLIVFPGHEEYVTPHEYDLVVQFRDDGGNLAFLSADNFFYRVTYIGHDMVGRARWRDLGRPEAALVGAQYVGWEENRFPNRPYRVVDAAAAPWLFAGTGLRDRSTFGWYGIEIDAVAPASPPGTRVLAAIPDDFGGLRAQMTLYREDGATVFDAGVMNFGGSSDWPLVSRLLTNLWEHLA